MSPRGILKKNVAHWQGTEKVTVSYGQGMAVTAEMQLVAAMNTIANGGTYVPPRLVQGDDRRAGHPPRSPGSSEPLAQTVLRPEVAGQDELHPAGG